MRIKIVQGLILASTLSLPMSGFAATSWTFHYEDNCVPGACDGNYYNGADFSRSYYENGGTSTPVDVYGVYNVGSSTGPAPAADATSGGGNLWIGPIDAWDGLGVHTYGESWDAPNHSTDNSGAFESVLFDFGANNLVSLEQVTLGWTYSDSDISVLAYTPGAGQSTSASIVDAAAAAAAQVPNTSANYQDLGDTYQGLLSSGWDLVGHYSNVGTNSPTSINSGGIQSRYWLIGAANPQFGWNYTTGNDFFKILTLAGSAGPGGCQYNCGGGQVPVPGTLLLLGAGLIALRRRDSLLRVIGR